MSVFSKVSVTYFCSQGNLMRKRSSVVLKEVMVMEGLKMRM